MAIRPVIAHGNRVSLEDCPCMMRTCRSLHVFLSENILANHTSGFADIELFGDMSVVLQFVAAKSSLSRFRCKLRRHVGIMLQEIQHANIVSQMLAKYRPASFEVSFCPVIVDVG